MIFVQANSSYLCIIERFPRASLVHLTGFKFKYQHNSVEDPKLRFLPTSSLYFLAARLIKHNFITIEDLYPHLLPSDATAIDEYNKRFEKTSSSVGSIALPTGSVICSRFTSLCIILNQ